MRREGSLTVERSNQSGSGGSTPTPSLHIQRVAWKDIRNIFLQFHYRKDAMGGSAKFHLALFDNQKIIGGAVLGDPRHRDKYQGAIELRRLACIDIAPKNTESYFIGRIFWWLRKNTKYRKVISYADPSAGHQGTIYKATNFKLIGRTGKSQKVLHKGREYHMRSLTIDRPYAKLLKQAVDSGEATIIGSEGKLIFLREF